MHRMEVLTLALRPHPICLEKAQNLVDLLVFTH